MSKKTIIISGIAIGLLLIIALICIVHSEKGNRVKNLYEKITQNQNFTFSMEEINREIKYKVFMAQRGTDVSIDMYSEDEHTTTIVLEDDAYYINHNDQEYYDFGEENVEADIVLYGLENFTKDKYETGREEINGKSYYYEEYENNNMEFIMYANANEESNIKIRFYFDGDELAYIKNIVTNKDGQEEELLKTSLVYSVDDSLFVVPEDYAETDE